MRAHKLIQTSLFLLLVGGLIAAVPTRLAKLSWGQIGGLGGGGLNGLGRAAVSAVLVAEPAVLACRLLVAETAVRWAQRDWRSARSTGPAGNQGLDESGGPVVPNVEVRCINSAARVIRAVPTAC